VSAGFKANGAGRLHDARMTKTEAKWAERFVKPGGRTTKGYAEGREFKASTLVYCASCVRTGVGGAPCAKTRAPR
jgi:hypothetical protein